MSSVSPYLLAHSDGVFVQKNLTFPLQLTSSPSFLKGFIYILSLLRISQTTTGHIINFYSDNLPFFFFPVLHFWLFPVLVFFFHLEYNECIVCPILSIVQIIAFNSNFVLLFWDPSQNQILHLVIMVFIFIFFLLWYSSSALLCFSYHWHFWKKKSGYFFKVCLWWFLWRFLMIRITFCIFRRSYYINNKLYYS